MLTQAERITALEVKVDSLQKTVDGMDAKIDELISIRNKGAGAFLLASTIFGTSVVSFIAAVLGWFK